MIAVVSLEYIMSSNLIELRSIGFLVRYSTANNALFVTDLLNKFDVYEFPKIHYYHFSSMHAAFNYLYFVCYLCTMIDEYSCIFITSVDS